MASYPRPTSWKPFTSVNPRVLDTLPPLPRSWLSNLPSLPSPIRTSPISGYKLTTHIVPTAYLRSAGSKPEPLSPLNETNAERKIRLKAFSEQMLLKRRVQADDEARRSREGVEPDMDEGMSGGPLWVVVNRFLREGLPAGRGNKDGLTLVMANANGMHKETFEPTIKRFVDKLKTSTVRVDEIWTMDPYNHGDSALLNEGKLGDLFNWADNARDMLHFLLHYLPEVSTSETLPTHLPRVTDDISKGRSESGYKHRTLVAVGHSLGGCSFAYATLSCPSLFSSLVLVDPTINPTWYVWNRALSNYASGALTRRTQWSSRAEAAKLLGANPFFGSWHPEVLQAYVDHGMTQISPDGAVKLKTSGFQEAAVFSENRVPVIVWELLPQLDERIKIRWIMSGKDTTVSGGPEGTPEVVWRRPGNCSNVKLPAGHLITQEAPDALASEITDFLVANYSLTHKPKL